MLATSSSRQFVRRSLLLAIAVGLLAQLALSTILPIIGEVAGRSWAMAVGATDSWAEHTGDATSFGWQVIQAILFIGSLIAGGLAAYLAPRRPWLVALVLVFSIRLGAAY